MGTAPRVWTISADSSNARVCREGRAYEPPTRAYGIFGGFLRRRGESVLKSARSADSLIGIRGILMFQPCGFVQGIAGKTRSGASYASAVWWLGGEGRPRHSSRGAMMTTLRERSRFV